MKITEKQFQLLDHMFTAYDMADGVNTEWWTEIIVTDMSTIMSPPSIGALITTLAQKGIFRITKHTYTEDGHSQIVKVIQLTDIGKDVVSKLAKERKWNL